MKDQNDTIAALLETQNSLVAELKASYEREKLLLEQLQTKKRRLPNVDVDDLKARAVRAAKNPRRAGGSALRKARRLAGRVKRSLTAK